MSRTLRITILLLAAALLTWSVPAMAQAPVITNISPQPSSAGSATSLITITGQNFGSSTDKVFVPGYPPQEVPLTSWGPGQLTIQVPKTTFSGTLAVQVAGQNGLADFVVSFASDDTKWHSLPLHWELNQNGAPGVAIANVVFALNMAFDTWECSSGFDHTYDGLTTRVGSNTNDGYNVQSWQSSPWAEPSMIAKGYITSIVATGEITEVDIVYNSANFTWSIGGGPSDMDIQEIATHESGHAIGLLDLYGYPDREKTMYGIHENGETFARSLHEHDVLGAEFLYPHGGRGNNREGTPSGWWGPIVARDAADATDSWAPLSSSLPGFVEVYASFAETNDGLDCLAPTARKYLYLDGVTFNNGGWYGRLSPGAFYNLKNQPVTVPGGRHTLRVNHDVNNDLVESNEYDNTYRTQFAWTPFGLADQHPEVRPAPPEQGAMAYKNCDAYMFTGNWWGAVASTPSNVADDYDIHLYDNYSDSQTSYTTGLASSVYVAGRTDWVAVNGNVVGEGVTRTAGTAAYSAVAGADVVVQQSNQVGPTYYPGFNVGDSASTGERLLVLNQNIKVHEFYLGDTGITYDFELKNLSGGADLDLAILSPTAAYQSPSTAVALAQDFGPGWNENVQYEPVVAGYYGAVVYKRGSADLPLESHYELVCRVAVPNLDATDVPTGNDYPVVARNTTGATPGNVHLTPTLDGNTLNTYLSFSVEQEGPNDSPQWRTDLYLDDELLEFAWSGEPVPVTSVQWLNYGPYEVRGGRHTLEIHADATEALDERNEADNYYMTQYVWSPLDLTPGVPVLREVPPPLGYLTWVNCDGFSFTRNPSNAWVVGMTPFAADDDYDLNVYSNYLNSQDGFDTAEGGSWESPGQTDFVVGHYLAGTTRILPGVFDFGSPSREPYTIQPNESGPRQDDMVGEFLYQGMGPLHVVDVYEANLQAGQRVLFKLEKLAGGGELKLHVFPATLYGVYGKSDPHDISTTFVEGEEWLVFEIPADGWYPIVVAREDYRGLQEYVEYNLTWGPTDISAVVDPILTPTKLMFMAPAPNPTSGETALAFELPGEGKVHIDVFDVRGHRVMTVADRPYPAGRHQVRWNGRDDQGRLAATGVYYARLRYAGQTLTRRMTVLR